jgi:hypothetical protein
MITTDEVSLFVDSLPSRLILEKEFNTRTTIHMIKLLHECAELHDPNYRDMLAARMTRDRLDSSVLLDLSLTLHYLTPFVPKAGGGTKLN